MITFGMINATVLFLGTAIGTLLVGRSILKSITGSAIKSLKSGEENLRAEALKAVAAAVCKHAEAMASVAQSNARLAQRSSPRREPRPAAPNTLQAANQTSWRRAPLRAAGFTMPELLTSITVVAILAAASIPGLTGLMLDTRVKTAAVDIYSTMIYARSEAIKRNANVDIVPVGGNWKNGWTVQAGTTVLKAAGPSTKGLDDITAPATITYRSDGRLTTPGTVTYVLGVSGNPNVMARRVIVDTAGRPSIRQGLS